MKAIIPRSLGTRSQRINPWILADQPAATICKTDAGYELKEAQIGPNCQSFRVLTGQERKKHFGLVRLDPEKPCPPIQNSQPESSTTGLIHPYEVRHLTISEIKLLSSTTSKLDQLRLQEQIVGTGQPARVAPACARGAGALGAIGRPAAGDS